MTSHLSFSPSSLINNSDNSFGKFVSFSNSEREISVGLGELEREERMSRRKRVMEEKIFRFWNGGLRERRRREREKRKKERGEKEMGVEREVYLWVFRR